jgi:putative ABC transport system permease protein
MFLNYLKSTYRNLLRHTAYSLINILGITIGMVASVLLLLWVQDELSYDKFHSKHESIYQAVANLGTADNKQAWYSAPAALGAFAKRDVPEVSEVVRIMHSNRTRVFTYADKNFVMKKAAFVDPSFFTMFDFKLKAGSIEQPFPNDKSIILSESAARRFFAEEDPIGKELKLDTTFFVVNGIMEDMPSNSSIQAELLFSFQLLINRFEANEYWKSLETDFGNFGYETYFQLHSEASIAAVEEKLTTIQRANNRFDHSTYYTLQPLAKVHLYDANGGNSKLQLVRIFMIVTIVILLIACINYINLSTARASKRAKEVGVRKVMGANRYQVFWQFLGESAIMICIALFLTLLMLELLTPVYNDLTGKEINIYFTDPVLLSVLGMIMLTTLLVAGVYPAILLSSFNPLSIMKGKLSSGTGAYTFRKVLVITQFSFSIALVICTLIIGAQMEFIRSKELGYAKENIFTFNLRGDLNEKYAGIKNELLAQPGIIDITTASADIVNFSTTTGDTDWDGKAPNASFMVNALSVDINFKDMLGMELAEGMFFSGSKADSAHYILNEAAVRAIGFTDPIGKRFSLWRTEGKIIGVIKDFHYSSIHEKIEPLVMVRWPQWSGSIYVKTTGADASTAIAAAEQIWKKFEPSYPFDYRFMDETYDNLYKADQRTGKLFNYFAGITILISCLGLFGLAAFTAEQRTKEIGIRKVLGASVGGIVGLLSKDFIKLVLVANLIAWPVAWWAMSKWLEDFAYRISIGPWVFVVAAVVAIAIALVTVSFQAVKAAIANPVKSLRSE